MAVDSASSLESKFPCSLVIRVPFPSSKLALTALRTLSVDQELSPLVRRSFGLVDSADIPGKQAVLETVYEATTNRMLRVAVNGFFDSLSTIIQVMDELDVDSLHREGKEELTGAQGLVSAPVAANKS